MVRSDGAKLSAGGRDIREQNRKEGENARQIFFFFHQLYSIDYHLLTVWRYKSSGVGRLDDTFLRSRCLRVLQGKDCQILDSCRFV